MTSPHELVGVASRDRFFAAISDNLLSIVGAAVVASAVGPIGDPLPTAVLILLYFVYYFLSEGLLGSTPGKLFCGLCVRRVTGERCTWGQAAVRTLARFVEVNPILLGGLPAALFVLATRRHQRLGDLLAGTVVVSWNAEGGPG